MGLDLEHQNCGVSFEPSKGEHRGLWSRVGTNIVYAAAVNATMDLYRTSTYLPTRRKFCQGTTATSTRRIWLLPKRGARKPVPLMETPFAEQEGQFSTDGRWIVYSSDESGSREIYVRSFPGPPHQYRISWGGGPSALESRGREHLLSDVR